MADVTVRYQGWLNMSRQAWSWSRLQLAEQCLLKYCLQNVLKAPNFRFVDTPALKNGKRIHKLFEVAAKKILEIKLARVSGNTDGIPEPMYPEEIYRYIKTIYKLIDTADDIVIENETAVDYEGNIVDYFSKKVWLRYAIDFGVRVGTKGILIDWKTGKNWGPSDQLKLFAVIAMTYIWPEVDEVESCYVFVESGEVVREKYYRKDLKALWVEFNERVDVIQMAFDNNEWPAIENRFCRNCYATPDQCEVKCK